MNKNAFLKSKGDLRVFEAKARDQQTGTLPSMFYENLFEVFFEAKEEEEEEVKNDSSDEDEADLEAGKKRKRQRKSKSNNEQLFEIATDEGIRSTLMHSPLKFGYQAIAQSIWQLIRCLRFMIY